MFGKVHKTIIYVNFAPYENAGRILDYLLLRFERVILFSFNFHTLSKSQSTSTLAIYENKKIVQTRPLFQTPAPPNLAFILLPIRSLVIFLQIIWHSLYLKGKFGTIDEYFTVNAFTAWTGNILRSLGLVKKTRFWIWDYYPPVDKNMIVSFMRWLYWKFDDPASRQSDSISFLNRHLKELRQEIGVLPKSDNHPIVEIGTDPVKSTSKNKISKTVQIVFLGVIKKIQGLELFYDAANKIASLYPNTVLHVIGGGPDMEYFKKRSKDCPLKTVFHGYIKDENKVNAIISRCHIGIAPYIPDESNCMYYSDPSKIKRYMNYGLPVITTNVFDFSQEIKKNKVGIVISYTPTSLFYAIKLIIEKYSLYQYNSYLLAKKYSYKKLYEKIFTD